MKKLLENEEHHSEEDVIYIAEISEKEKQMIRSMKGNEKIWNYFLHLTRDKNFISHINTIKDYNLDNNGKVKDTAKFFKIIDNLCQRFGLDSLSWSEILENYILKNELPKESLSTPCIVLDRVEIGEDEYPDGEYEDDPDDMPKEPIELEPWSYSHPVIIRVSAYASEREIIDYIKKAYTLYIKPIQANHQKEKILLGKVRKRDPKIQERNDFIYENKTKPYKEIRALLVKKKIYIDDGLIGKIISNETKKRT